jgi:hypothetical protein
MAVEFPNSSWGQSAPVDDIRALRRYNWLLRRLASTGEALVYVLLVTFICIAGAFLFAGNFENAIFADGTSLSCFYDGSTGKIVNVK